MTTTVTERGQTVVPAAIRRRYGLGAASKLAWVDDGECLRVVPLPADTIKAARGLFRGQGLRQALLKSRRGDQARE